MYSYVIIILTKVIKMATTKNHIWLHDYVWTLVARCPSVVYWACTLRDVRKSI